MLLSRLAIATLFTVFALSISVAAQTVVPPEFKVLKPGPVIPMGPDNFQLTGSFSVSRGTNAQPLEERSFGSGGACIYADLAAVGAPELSCTNNSQCTQAFTSFHEANLGNPNYDVASFSGSSGQCIANKCWYRPGARLCTRMIPPGSFALGHHKFGPFNLDHVAKFFGDDAKIDWQVVTCSNRAQENGRDDTSCATGQGIYNPPSNAKATDWEEVVRYPNEA
ncbi:hypothetical protein [Altererythrobacter sp. BO-6]|uniref:hypothetical protein n=1 Tax=Altererythrobacter sp. BO-6 TaxID=2604537 RepID=UPI0019CF899F|nr:hypothetical protein [Altererythrobacter sp. BO-6]